MRRRKNPKHTAYTDQVTGNNRVHVRTAVRTEMTRVEQRRKDVRRGSWKRKQSEFFFAPNGAGTGKDTGRDADADCLVESYLCDVVHCVPIVSNEREDSQTES